MSRESRAAGPLVPHTLLHAAAERGADRPFLLTDGRTHTYEQVHTRAGRLAGLLRSLGVEPGDRVATMLEPGPDYVEAWFAVSMVGAVEVPINTAFSGEFLFGLLNDCTSSTMIVAAEWVDRLDSARLPQLRHVVTVATGSPDGESAAAPYPPPGLVVTPASAAASCDPVGTGNSRETDLGYVFYTSGTTGPSKGVVHTHRSLLTNSVSAAGIGDLGADDVAYSFFPLFHITGRTFVLGSTLLSGGAVLVRSRFSLNRFWSDVRSAEVTWFPAMGAVVHILLSAEQRADDAANSVRLVCASAVTPEIRAHFTARFGVEMLDVYGMTETGTVSSQRIGRARPGTSGSPLPHIEVAIHDEDGRALPAGQEGEIVVRPREPGVIFTEYWSRPDATVAATRDLWFHTGDRGLLDDHGELVFKDRLKDSIRRRGENISSFEVERVINEHPAVVESAVYGVPSELSEEEVMVTVIAAEGAAVDAPALWAWCQGRLPGYAVPRYVRFAKELPKNASQRILKQELRSLGVLPDTADRDSAEGPLVG